MQYGKLPLSLHFPWEKSHVCTPISWADSTAWIQHALVDDCTDQIRIDPTKSPVASSLLSGENAAAVTASEWPSITLKYWATNQYFALGLKTMYKHFQGAIRNAPDHCSFVVSACDYHATVRWKTTRSHSGPTTLQWRVCPPAWAHVPQADVAVEWTRHQLASIRGKFNFVDRVSMSINWRKRHFFEPPGCVLMPNFNKFVAENQYSLTQLSECLAFLLKYLY